MIFNNTNLHSKQNIQTRQLYNRCVRRFNREHNGATGLYFIKGTKTLFLHNPLSTYRSLVLRVRSVVFE